LVDSVSTVRLLDEHRLEAASSGGIFFRCVLVFVEAWFAPIAAQLARASAGFSMWRRPIAPSAAPAPTSVCSSSMNKMICPSASVISFRTASAGLQIRRGTLRPPPQRGQSSAHKALGFQTSGDVAGNDALRKPSTMAVFPTPGSRSKLDCSLVAPRQNLHHAADFLIAANDRIQLLAAAPAPSDRAHIFPADA